MTTKESVLRLYEIMDILSSAMKRVAFSWNDSVSSAISVNQINEIVMVCNNINADLYSKADKVEVQIGELMDLVNEE